MRLGSLSICIPDLSELQVLLIKVVVWVVYLN